jgi:mannose-6-phosphate isomerase-like protein (cupin superfamily)
MTTTTFAPHTAPPTITPGSLSAQDLAALVAELADYRPAWAPYLRFGTNERWWTRLRGDDTVDVWLLTWVTDSGTDLHDHGESAGAFTVVSGTLEEVRPEGPAGELIVTALHTGDVRVIDRGVVHDVRSPSLAPAISIHAYSPPLREMTFYEQGEWGPQPVRTVATEPERTPV